MTQFNPYLVFNGDCAAAMRFYERVLGGKLNLMTHADGPAADRVPPADAHRVMHAHLAFDGGVLMASDAMSSQPASPMRGFSLALTCPTAAEARRVFDALAEGGKVNVPLQKTFWAEAWGQLFDRFGTPWMVNGGMTM